MSSLGSSLPQGSDPNKPHPTHLPGGTFSRFELTGKVAVVSGGARGLGYAHASLYFPCRP